MARNRVIYQTEALFVNKQYSGHTTLDIVDGNVLGGVFHSGSFHQIHRVQSANYGFSINRTDVNQFGNLARIDSVVIDAPNVSFDFSYLLTNGTNEDKLGITVDPYVEIGTTGATASSVPTNYGPRCSVLSGILANSSGRNYHVLTVAEGTDANIPSGSLLGDDTAAQEANKGTAATSQVISIGNGFITNYSVNGSVGGLPTASVSVEGLNITSQNASSGMSGPAINPANGTMGSLIFQLPQPTDGSSEAKGLNPSPHLSGDIAGDVIRPGDIDVSIEGSLLPNIDGAGSKTKAHIQSFSIDLPLGRSALQRVGNSFAFARVIDFPVQVSCSFSALVADLQSDSSLFNELYDTNKHDLKITLNRPTAGGSSVGVSGSAQMAYVLKNCTLESESFSSSIGDNKSVDLTFSATVGSAEDSTNGLFISGRQCGPFSERGTP